MKVAYFSEDISRLLIAADADVNAVDEVTTRYHLLTLHAVTVATIILCISMVTLV
jgi:hypothetical protein